MCVAKGKEHGEPVGTWREAQRDEPRGLRDLRGEQPCQQPSLREAGMRELPPDPQTHPAGMGVMIPALPAPLDRADPTGSRQVRGVLAKADGRYGHGNAAWSLLCSLAGTKRRDWRVFTGFVYPKAEGCFHSGSNWKDRKQRAGSRGGVFRLKFLWFLPHPLPPSFSTNQESFV